jgi:anti-anti-sigma factor
LINGMAEHCDAVGIVVQAMLLLDNDQPMLVCFASAPTGHTSRGVRVNDLQISAEQTASGFLVQLAGDADGEKVDELDRQLRLISNLNPREIVIDLSKLNFISSVGMGLLVRIQQQLKPTGGSVILLSPRPLVRDALRRASLQKIFEIREESGAS